MKTKTAASCPIPTAAQLKKQRVRRVSCIILRILLVLSTILFTWITCWGCGLGWISRARAGSNWPMSFVGYGQMLLVGSGLLTRGRCLSCCAGRTGSTGRRQAVRQAVWCCACWRCTMWHPMRRSIPFTAS